MNSVLGDASSQPLVLRDDDFRSLKPALQAGVGVRAKPGQTLRRFLTGDLGIDPSYVEGRLQTVLLDGAPVDDVEAAILSPGCTVALSGAMPGLAGATMRRGGYYARMREGIAYANAGGSPESADLPAEAIVFVKLFNRALEDLGRNLVSGRELLIDRHWLIDLPADLNSYDNRDDGPVWVTVVFKG